MSLIAELKRRNVFRVGVAYAIVAWLLLEVASVIFPGLHLPDWTLTFLVFLVVVGFPLAVIFAWAFELTPEGIKRESAVDPAEPITHVTGRKLDFAIIGLLVIAVVYFAVDKFVLEAEPEQAEVAGDPGPTAEAVEREKSIAVLPFVNMSGDPEQEYFSDGITEEIISALVKIPRLSVPARTSVFAFKGHLQDVREIGRELNVAHVLEGSIRSQGEQIRITAQLVKVDDGFHLWSETFDRRLENIFAVQEEIAAAIAQMLVGELDIDIQTVPHRTSNMQAYDTYLHGRVLLRDRDEEAIDVLREVTVTDPSFAPAWAALAIAYQVEGYRSRNDDYQEIALKIAQHALSLDSENVDALDALASVLRDTWQWAEAEKYFQIALAIDPQSSELLEDYAEFLCATARFDEYLAVSEKAYALDPNLSPLIDGYTYALTIHGRHQEAMDVMDRHAAKADFFGPVWKLPVLLAAGNVDSASALIESISTDELPADIATTYTNLLRNHDDEGARTVLRSVFSPDNWSIYENYKYCARYVLLFTGDDNYVVETLFALFQKIMQGNAEIIWHPLLSSARQLPAFGDVLELLNLPTYWDSVRWPDICSRDVGGKIRCQ
jgi:TolB-like protein